MILIIPKIKNQSFIGIITLIIIQQQKQKQIHLQLESNQQIIILKQQIQSIFIIPRNLCEPQRMLSQALIRQSKQLQSLQIQDYKKVINYSINLILNSENQMKLNCTSQQFIQIDEQKGDHITNITLSLIRALAKYKTSTKQFDADLSLLLISKQRKAYLKQKIQPQLYELRKIIYSEDLASITHLKNLQWRFQIQLASKTYKNQFTPNILLNLQTEEKGVSKKTVFNCDLAGLKNLHQTLHQAMKMHGSNKYKVARNSSI